jgi:hypothetical protein
MIALPDGQTTFKLFEQKNETSHEFYVRMPAGFLAASYRTIHESAFLPGFGSPPAIPDPGPGQEGRSATYPAGLGGDKYFGNASKSFRWN